MKRIALIAATILLCAPLAGCPSQNQDAIAINAAGALCSIVLINDGDSTGASQCITISGQLATAIKNLVPGSTTENIVQLGNSLVAIIQADTNSKGAEETAAIIATILNVIGEYNAPVPTAVGIAVPATALPATAGPHTKAELYAAYNAALKVKPVPGLKPIK